MHNKAQQFAADGRRTPFTWLLRRHSKVAAVLRRYAYHGYVHMKKIITQALLIALPYSFLVSVLFYTLTINFFAVSPGEPSEIVYYGFDAVRHMIREYGLVNYLAGILPHYIFFGCSILIALIIQGIINGKPKNA